MIVWVSSTADYHQVSSQSVDKLSLQADNN